MSHDHNFKYLILDYPHQAIRGLVTLEPSPEKRLK